MVLKRKDNKKILVLGNSHLVVFGFRGELIKRLLDDGNEVAVAFPNGPFGEGEKTSKEYGCRFIEVEMNRRGTNPFEDLTLFIRYLSILRKINPDVVLGFTVKSDVYGGIACRLLRIPFIPNITGLGKGLNEQGLVKHITIWLYKMAVSKAKCVFFQNQSDRKFFIENGISFRKERLLPGSGVNLIKYTPMVYPKDDKIIFTYIARIMKAKGIEQFLEAAETLKRKHSNVEFHICGFCEEDYKDRIQRLVDDGVVIYHGLVNDIKPYQSISHCIVLPTFHPEGVSNVLLEAAACARPIIATDRPGCREAVDDGISGYLVKEKDAQDLISKMEKFMQLDRASRIEMGLAGRRKVEREFNREIVVANYIEEIFGSAKKE